MIRQWRFKGARPRWTLILRIGNRTFVRGVSVETLAALRKRGF